MPWFGSERLVNEVRTTFDGMDKVILTIVIIAYPNIFGLRVLMLVAILVSAALVSTRFLTASALIGATTGLAMLYNLETVLAARGESRE
jgi:hypothetical protein